MSEDHYPRMPGSLPRTFCLDPWRDAVKRGTWHGCQRCYCLRYCTRQHVPWPYITRAGCTSCGMPRWRFFMTRRGGPARVVMSPLQTVNEVKSEHLGMLSTSTFGPHLDNAP